MRVIFPGIFCVVRPSIMKPKTSPIWNYFVDIDAATVRCKLCYRLYSRKGRTTTALKSHIRAMHVDEFVEFEKLDEAAKLSLDNKSQEVPSSRSATATAEARGTEARAAGASVQLRLNCEVCLRDVLKMGDKWGADKIIKFLEEYRKHECLWNIRNGLYKNRQARDASYQIISQEMSTIFCTEMSVKAVKDKIRSLRNTYLTEVKKIIESKRSGAEHVYEPKLKWFQAMEFLRHVEELRHAQYNFVAESASSLDYCGDGSPSTKYSEHKRRRHSTSSRYNEDDEFDVFARNVALQLKKLPLDYALESQELIQRVLKEQRIKAMKEEMSQKSPDSYSPREAPQSTLTRAESSPSPSEPCLVICENNDLIKLENCDDDMY